MPRPRPVRAPREAAAVRKQPPHKPSKPSAEKTDIFLVIGSHTVCGVEPGGLVELPVAHAHRLLRSGNVSRDLEPATDDSAPVEIETSDAVSDSDQAGHELPDSTESDN